MSSIRNSDANKGLTSAEMRRIDQAAVDRFQIPVLLLMDQAGRAIAEEARRLLTKGSKKIIVLTGGGHNGGDGVAAARYLQGWGFGVNVFWLKDPLEWEDDVARHFQMAKRAGVPFFPFAKVSPKKRVQTLREADLVIDALLGTGTHGHLRLPFFDAIAAMNAAKRPVISVDIPSGLDPDTGEVTDIAVKAKVTVTMAVPKTGLLKPSARSYVGRLVVADIGIPARLITSSTTVSVRRGH